jgi:hypothetical protein
MKKSELWRGPDHTYLLSIFLNLILKTGIREGENLIFAGCEGPCYSMATFFSFAIRDLKVNLYFATNADMSHLWKLDSVENLGMAARRSQRPLKAKVLVLMSGLIQIPLEKTLTFVDDVLEKDGIIIGETVVSGLFEERGWDKRIAFNYLFEFSMRNPVAYEIEGERYYA